MDCPNCAKRLPHSLPFMKKTCRNCGWVQPRRSWAQIKKDWGR